MNKPFNKKLLTSVRRIYLIEHTPKDILFTNTSALYESAL